MDLHGFLWIAMESPLISMDPMDLRELFAVQTFSYGPLTLQRPNIVGVREVNMLFSVRNTQDNDQGKCRFVVRHWKGRNVSLVCFSSGMMGDYFSNIEFYCFSFVCPG